MISICVIMSCGLIVDVFALVIDGDWPFVDLLLFHIVDGFIIDVLSISCILHNSDANV